MHFITIFPQISFSLPDSIKSENENNCLLPRLLTQKLMDKCKMKKVRKKLNRQTKKMHDKNNKNYTADAATKTTLFLKRDKHSCFINKLNK